MPPRISHEQVMLEERQKKVDAAKKAEQDRLQQAELNDVNFPSLGSAFDAGAPKATAWSKSGKELAQAWKQADDQHQAEMRAEELARKEEEDRERREAERYLRRRPQYAISARNEDTYYEDEDEPPTNGGAGYHPPPQDDGWARVEKKTRVRREHHMSEDDDAPPDSVWDDGTQNDQFDTHARPGRRNDDSIW